MHVVSTPPGLPSRPPRQARHRWPYAATWICVILGFSVRQPYGVVLLATVGTLLAAHDYLTPEHLGHVFDTLVSFSHSVASALSLLLEGVIGTVLQMINYTRGTPKAECFVTPRMAHIQKVLADRLERWSSYRASDVEAVTEPVRENGFRRASAALRQWLPRRERAPAPAARPPVALSPFREMVRHEQARLQREEASAALSDRRAVLAAPARCQHELAIGQLIAGVHPRRFWSHCARHAAARRPGRPK